MSYFGFVRRKRCGSCLAVRVGPKAKKEGAPWIRKVEGQYSGKVATLEAYERPKGTKKLPPSFYDAVLTALFDDGFEAVELERMGRNPRNLIFTRKEGKITMQMKRSKHERKQGRKMPHTDEAVRQDGTLDPVALKAAGSEVLASFEAKEYTPLTHTVVDLGAVKPGLEAYVLVRQKN